MNTLVGCGDNPNCNLVRVIGNILLLWLKG